ncbi:hypothetical protein GEMRC1_014212 [Eukaryota sp. GEM-RC1]
MGQRPTKPPVEPNPTNSCTSLTGSSSTQSTHQPELDNSDSNKVPVIFRWPYPGKLVYIAGAFTQWDKRKIKLSPGPDRILQAELRLPPGRWHYKYIVDTEWRYSPAEPTSRDALGNVNNFIEVLPPCDDSPVAASRSIVFGQEVPELPSKAPDPLPRHLAKTVLNSTVPEDTDPLLLPIPQHITINHLYVWPRRSVLMLGTTRRYKAKSVTNVLYKPMNQEMVKSLQQNLSKKSS